MTTTPTIKPASFGSVSTGTLRTEDLLSKFASELEWQIQRNGDYFAMPENFSERDRLNNLIGEAQDCFAEDGETLTEEGEESAPEIIDEIQDALQSFAPAYGYFGAHFGDGADFGFWVNIEGVKEEVEFVSSKAQEYPDDEFRGEWLHVSDHGNATLYVRGEDGKDVEVWGIV